MILYFFLFTYTVYLNFLEIKREQSDENGNVLIDKNSNPDIYNRAVNG